MLNEKLRPFVILPENTVFLPKSIDGKNRFIKGPI